MLSPPVTVQKKNTYKMPANQIGSLSPGRLKAIPDAGRLFPGPAWYPPGGTASQDLQGCPPSAQESRCQGAEVSGKTKSCCFDTDRMSGQTCPSTRSKSKQQLSRFNCVRSISHGFYGCKSLLKKFYYLFIIALKTECIESRCSGSRHVVLPVVNKKAFISLQTVLFEKGLIYVHIGL